MSENPIQKKSLPADRPCEPLEQTFINALNLLNSSPDMIIAVDNDRRIIEFNAAAERAFGYTRDEIIGEHVSVLYAETDGGYEIHRETINSGHCSREIKNRKKNGEIFHSYISTSILYDSDGQKIGVMGVSRDISKLRMTENRLKVSQEYAKNLIDCSMDMIIAVDNNRNIIEFNKAAVDTFGYQPEEVLGKSVNILYADPDEGREVHRRTTVRGRVLHEVRSRRKDGEEFISLISASLLRNEKGEQVGVMGISRDITSIKRAEEILRRSEERHRILSTELAEANIMKELLLDVISHDFKNTISTLSRVIKQLEKEYGDNEYIRSIHQYTYNLMNIIESASVLTQVTIGEEIEKKEMNLTQMITDISKEFVVQLENARMTLQLDLPGDLYVQANPIISEVFVNYISNAIKYANSGRKIIVAGIRTENEIVIEVRDFGKTIDWRNHDSIFQRKVQLAGSKKTGRGLGLAIVSRIARVHDAEVGVKPNVPNGNIFYISFPVPKES